MKRIKLTVAYDGTHYCGWQRQPGQPTVEGKLNQVLSEFLMEEIEITGASRTDSGVHALGNVAIFDTDTKIPPEKLAYGLNQRLPEDIQIMESCQVADDFHPRYSARKKIYQYRILNSRFPIPTERLYSYHVYNTLDHKEMHKAGQVLVGSHNFKGFCSGKTEVLDMTRTIYRIDVMRMGDIILIEVEGNGFLYNMVRIIAGTLIRAGMGKMDIEQIKDALERKDRTLAGPTAPAQGLSLIKIFYM